MSEPKLWGLEPFGPVPNHRHMEWYRRGKTAFIHFTVNTFTGREWGDGTEEPSVFAPSALDCRQWASVLKAGGFTAAILTAKHHDGFCLWPSKYTDHSVKNSPLAGRDVVREFVDACREYGIKPGIYLSPWDRHEKTWGSEAYNDFYAAQLTELMTEYGDIWECWWDGAGSAQARYDWQRWAGVVRAHQPDCVIWGCLGAAPYVDARWVGNESGRAGADCWATIDPDAIEGEDVERLNTGDPGGSRFIPAETNLSIRPGWFYHASQDAQVMDEEALVDYWFRSAGRNTAILLNLPPDTRGLIHETDAANVKAWNDRMNRIFAKNLAQGSRLEAEPGARALLSDDEMDVYAASERTAEVTLEFSEEVTFDCVLVQEAIELGHRVRSFVVEARTEGIWKVILEGKCMGFCRAERFSPITADAVRLRILEAAEKPVLRRLALFAGAAPLEKEEAREAKELIPAGVLRREREIEVQLGGIYPFNTVELGDMAGKKWQVHAFNGARYVPVAESTEESCRFADQTGSYQLLITADEPVPEDVQVRVLYRQSDI